MCGLAAPEGTTTDTTRCRELTCRLLRQFMALTGECTKAKSHSQSTQGRTHVSELNASSTRFLQEEERLTSRSSTRRTFPPALSQDDGGGEERSRDGADSCGVQSCGVNEVVRPGAFVAALIKRKRPSISAQLGTREIGFKGAAATFTMRSRNVGEWRDTIRHQLRKFIYRCYVLMLLFLCYYYY